MENMAKGKSENMLIWNSTFKLVMERVMENGGKAWGRVGEEGIGWGASSEEEGGKKRGIKLKNPTEVYTL